MSRRIIPASKRREACEFTIDDKIERLERLIEAKVSLKPNPEDRFVTVSSAVPDEIVNLYREHGFTVEKDVYLSRGDGHKYTIFRWS
jgi:hypothetical protein